MLLTYAIGEHSPCSPVFPISCSLLQIPFSYTAIGCRTAQWKFKVGFLCWDNAWYHQKLGSCYGLQAFSLGYVMLFIYLLHYYYTLLSKERKCYLLQFHATYYRVHLHLLFVLMDGDTFHGVCHLIWGQAFFWAKLETCCPDVCLGFLLSCNFFSLCADAGVCIYFHDNVMVFFTGDISACSSNVWCGGRR